MVQSNKPWMLCIILFIATVSCQYTDEELTIEDDEDAVFSDDDDIFGQRAARRSTSLDETLSTTFKQIIKALLTVKNFVFDENHVLNFGRDEYLLPNGLTEPYLSYDYVIIGAGSAGSVVASRLSEDNSVRVLLIEVGKPESVLTDIPLIAPLFQRTEYATQYVTEKQNTSCWGMENQRCVWPRGSAVGGSSVIDDMIYTRGGRSDWDRMAANGCTGWSYNEVLQYYIKAEQCNLKDYYAMPYRGRQGNAHVSDVNFRTPLAHAFLDAAKVYGHTIGDYNSKEGYGFGYLQATLHNGRRHSAARAYLYPHRDRPNLHILHSTRATKILFDENNKAYGVEYYSYGLMKNVMATREVIVSAGPIASAQLLMLSGIGPASHLESFGIPVVQDLAVGETLYDHLFFPGQIYVLNTASVTLHETEATTSDQIIKWFNSGTGLAGSPGGVEAIGYIRTAASNDPDKVPDVELMDLSGSLLSDYTSGGSQAVRRGARITDDTFYSAFGSLKNEDTWSATPVLLHPKSKGYLELLDTSPFSHPKIYTNYLTDPSDVAAMISAIRTVQEFTKTPLFQQYGARLHRADYPQCKHHLYDTDGYWECALRTLASSLHHQTGTCKMGLFSDPQSVVDPQLRVHGVTGLRVVGTSVIPQTTSAHTNAPSMMIGEKAADLIKDAWKNFS